jgi:hypothetical protein
LRFEHWDNRDDALDFNYDEVFHEEVHVIGAEKMSFVVGGHAELTRILERSSVELDAESSLVY